jgi:hypothetical protein
MSYKNAYAAPSLESPPNLSATKIESQSDSYVIVPCLVGTPNKAQRNATLLSHISINPQKPTTKSRRRWEKRIQ